MDNRMQTLIRTKKLGVLIRDARLSARRTPQETAEAMGISRAMLNAYEEGRRAPSLPELEVLVYFLKLPINHFWGSDVISDDAPATASLDLTRLMPLRQRMIGALLRQERDRANLSLKDVSANTGISTARLKAYELGGQPIPLPELEVLLSVYGTRIQDFFDRSGPVGRWMTEQKNIQRFLELPEAAQNFICQPVNQPYLELAMKLSEMSKGHLRSVAEGLLDITL